MGGWWGEEKDVGREEVFDCVNGITCGLLALMKQPRSGLGSLLRRGEMVLFIMFYSWKTVTRSPHNCKHADFIRVTAFRGGSKSC